MSLPRFLHRWYAMSFGYFWLPCPRCGRMFGGHESDGGIDVTEQGDRWQRGKSTCSNCLGNRWVGEGDPTWDVTSCLGKP